MSSEQQPALLPVHGFVLAGGKSSRMGRDKATLEFRGRPMVEIAVEKLRGFCTNVSIVGNRDDLRRFAEVVGEERVDCGPAAGIEAGLKVSQQEWAMFVPVDAPLVPEEFLRRWVESVVSAKASKPKGSFLRVHGRDECAFCLLRKDRMKQWSDALDWGTRRLSDLLSDWYEAGVDAKKFVSKGDVRGRMRLEAWFTNVNTAEELAGAQAWTDEVERCG